MIHNHEVPGSIPGLATRNALLLKSISCLYIILVNIKTKCLKSQNLSDTLFITILLRLSLLLFGFQS